MQVEIIGGHTEITAAVNKPVIVSTAIGISRDSEKNSHKNMKPGDAILLTKRAGIEGAGVIANDNEEELKEVLTKQELEIAKGFLNEVSVVEEGVAAGSVGTCGMHDVTEGGVLGAIWEMCTVEGKGAIVYKDRIPVDSVTEKIAKFYDIDWLRLISSGCMLIVASSEKKDAVVKAVEDAGVAISEIGVIASPEDGIMIEENGIKSPVEPPASDELYKAVK